MSSAAASSLAKSRSVTVNTAHIVYLMSSLRSRALSRCLSSLPAAVSVIVKSLVTRNGGLPSPRPRYAVTWSAADRAVATHAGMPTPS